MSNQPEALRLADALEVDKWHISGVTAQSAADELRRLHAEVSRLQAWHQTAWQRGHAVGLNGLNQALRQMEDHKKSDAWGNTQLTEALMRAEEQRDELLEALKLALSAHGVLVLSDPPQDAWKTYGVEQKARAAIAKTEVQA
jgi:hypothetical protein